MAFQRIVRQIPIGEKVVEAILKLVRSARPERAPARMSTKYVSWGPVRAPARR